MFSQISRVGTIGALASIVLSTVATPMTSRGAQVDDMMIVNYVLTLEQLETAFYNEVLKFNVQDFENAGFSQSVREGFVQMSNGEAARMALLTKALGSNPTIKPCTYNFGVTDIFDLVDTTRFLETLVVSAHLGIMGDITNKSVLTDISRLTIAKAHLADSISVARNISDLTQPLGIPLGISQVMNIVETVVVNCPAGNPIIPFTKFRFLTFPFLVTVGQIATFTYNTTGVPSQQPLWMAFFGAPELVFVKVTNNKVVVPPGIVGISYAVVTSSNTEVTDDNVIAGPAQFDVQSA